MFLGKNINVKLFLFVTFAVTVINLIILQPVIKYQLIELADDWIWMVYYKSLSHMPLLAKLWYIWKKVGIHESGYAIYVGLLGEILGMNYQAYNYVNIFFKILSAVTLFPLILIVFKNRLLATITTFIYGITSASTGSLYWMMKGGMYLGITFMNLFLLSYYFAVTKKKIFWLILSSILIFITYISSAVRVYPVFPIIILIETIWLIFNRSKGDGKFLQIKVRELKTSIIRIVAFFLPVFLVASRAPVSPHGFIGRKTVMLLTDIKNGNLHDLLSPLAGIGSSFLPNYF